MKYLAILCLFSLVACVSDRNEPITRLWTEQKLLKDSVNVLNEKFGLYLQKGFYDSAAMQKTQVEAVFARLTEIQSSIDSRSK